MRVGKSDADRSKPNPIPSLPYMPNAPPLSLFGGDATSSSAKHTLASHALSHPFIPNGPSPKATLPPANFFHKETPIETANRVLSSTYRPLIPGMKVKASGSIAHTSSIDNQNTSSLQTISPPNFGSPSSFSGKHPSPSQTGNHPFPRWNKPIHRTRSRSPCSSHVREHRDRQVRKTRGRYECWSDDDLRDELTVVRQLPEVRYREDVIDALYEDDDGDDPPPLCKTHRYPNARENSASRHNVEQGWSHSFLESPKTTSSINDKQHTSHSAGSDMIQGATPANKFPNSPARQQGGTKTTSGLSRETPGYMRGTESSVARMVAMRREKQDSSTQHSSSQSRTSMGISAIDKKNTIAKKISSSGAAKQRSSEPAYKNKAGKGRISDTKITKRKVKVPSVKVKALKIPANPLTKLNDVYIDMSDVDYSQATAYSDPSQHDSTLSSPLSSAPSSPPSLENAGQRRIRRPAATTTLQTNPSRERKKLSGEGSSLETQSAEGGSRQKCSTTKRKSPDTDKDELEAKDPPNQKRLCRLIRGHHRQTSSRRHDVEKPVSNKPGHSEYYDREDENFVVDDMKPRNKKKPSRMQSGLFKF